MKRIGFIINPIAGMGGKVGLKGTDSREVLEEAIKRGSTPIADLKTINFLKHLIHASLHENIKFIIPNGKMGESIFRTFNKNHQQKINYETLLNYKISDETTGEDTIKLGI